MINGNCAFCGDPFQSRTAGVRHCSQSCGRRSRPDRPISYDSFWARVDKSNTDGCWLWTGFIADNGYGKLTINGNSMWAHRCAWAATYGHAPKDKFVCHTCDVRACCNPSHLFLATHTENMLDMRMKGRGKRGSVCPQAKLNEEKVALILASNAPRGQLAIEFDVSPATITHIRQRLTWKHVVAAA